MPLPFPPACLGVAHGPLPHRNPAQALALLRRTTPAVLAWPQLPLRSFREQGYIQAAAGFPGLVYDGVEERVFVDRVLLDQELDQLSLAYLQGNIDGRGLSVEDAAGLVELRRELTPSFRGRAIKGQMVGPVSLGMLLTDEHQRPLMYEPMLLEAVAQHLHLRALWQERQFAELAPGTIICLVEPFLEAIGSPFSPMSWDLAVDLIERVFEGVQGCRALDCDGAIPWDHVLATSVELLMINVDTQSKDLLAAEKLRDFVERGGAFAWGIVPANEESIERANVVELVAQLDELFAHLTERGVKSEWLPANSLVSTAASLEHVSVDAAERAMSLVAEVSTVLRDKYQLA